MAVRRLIAEAGGAPAAAVKADRHLVPGGDCGHIVAHGDDGPAAFVAEHAREDERQMALFDRDVGMTDAHTGDLDQNFVGGRGPEFDLGNGERSTHFLDHRG